MNIIISSLRYKSDKEINDENKKEEKKIYEVNSKKIDNIDIK